MSGIDVYTRAMCGYCAAAKALLSRKGVAFREIDLTFDKAGREKMIERAGGKRTFPQIFIGDTHVGGCDELMALDRAGDLDPLLEKAQAGAGSS